LQLRTEKYMQRSHGESERSAMRQVALPSLRLLGVLLWHGRQKIPPISLTHPYRRGKLVPFAGGRTTTPQHLLISECTKFGLCLLARNNTAGIQL
jgi:hypothetical protein